MKRKEDLKLEGVRFGKWTVISGPIRKRIGVKKTCLKPHWLVKCDCGFTMEIGQQNLLKGRSTGCMTCKRLHDLTGQTFGRLKIISLSHKVKTQWFWLAKCECGNETFASSNHLKTGNKKSCGCYQIEAVGLRARTHGKSKTPEFRTWADMIFRCNSSAPTAFKLGKYKQKGISVCERWSGENGFLNFLEDMGPRPSDKHSIDRIDNDGNYCKENCRWADDYQQMNNISRNRWVTWNGENMTLSQFCRLYNKNYSTVSARLNRGLTIEEAAK